MIHETQEGGLVDLMMKIFDCPQCKRMKVKQSPHEIECANYLSWYVQHKLECPVNHDGIIGIPTLLCFQVNDIYEIPSS